MQEISIDEGVPRLLARIEELYYQDKKYSGKLDRIQLGYAVALVDLCRIEPKAGDRVMTLSVERCLDSYDGSVFYHVNGQDGSMEDGALVSWAIEYVPWDQQLASIIDPKAIEEYGPLDTLVHILWEITWAGFTASRVDKAAKKLGYYEEG